MRIATEEVSKMTAYIAEILDRMGVPWRFDAEPQMASQVGPLHRARTQDGGYAKPIIGLDGERIMMNGYEIFSTNIMILGPMEMFDEVAKGALSDLKPDFGFTQSVRDALDIEVSTATGQPCEGCSIIDPDYEIVSGLKTYDFTPQQYPVQYFKLIRDER
jgi:hypothetical protein